jgi:hypothetical protein
LSKIRETSANERKQPMSDHLEGQREDSSNAPLEVRVVGVDVPITDLVTLYLKASIAAIPTALFWAIIYFAILSFIRAK